MERSASDNYLLTAIRTATPQKLHLMLIDAAMRSCQRAEERWQANRPDAARECLLNAQQVVGQLLTDIDPRSEAAGNISGVYLFVYRTLIAASRNRDSQRLHDVLRILAIERETWRLVCGKLASQQGAEPETAAAPSAPTRHVPPPLMHKLSSATPHSSFSVEG